MKEAQKAGQTMADKIKQGVEGINDSIKKFTPQLQKVGIALTAVAAGGALMLRDWAGAAKGAEVEMARFDQTLKATGKSTDEIRAQLLKAADAALKMGFDDEDAANVMANLFQRTGDVTQAIELNSLAMDLARKKNIGLAEAGNLVGQVLSGNGRVLKQYGIDVKEAGTPLEALAELQAVVGGQSAAYMETAAGKAEALAGQVASMKENLGAAVLPFMTKLTELSLELFTWFNSLSPEVTKMVAYFVLFGTAIAGVLAPLTGLILLLPTLTAGLGVLAVGFGALLSPIGLLVIAIGALTVFWIQNHQQLQDALTLFVMFCTAAWNSIKETAVFVFTALAGFFSSFFEGLNAVFSENIALISTAWSDAMLAIGTLATDVWEGLKATFLSGINWIIGKMNAFLGALKGVGSSLGNALGLGKKGLSLGTITPLANGGIVRATPGGILANIGEGGQDEVVMPLSKLGNFGGGWHIHIDGAIIGSTDAAVELLDMAMRRIAPRVGYS